VPNGAATSYRQLLSHTSRLADYFANKRIFAPYPGGNLTHTWSHKAIVRISTADKPLFAPGAPGKWSYSNTSYDILGLTVEQITGRPLAAELTRRIFRPLGLHRTTLPSTNKPSGRYAHGYTTDFGKKQQDVSVVRPSILWAAGGVVSTPANVATFNRALFRGRLLPLPLVPQMQSAQFVKPQAREAPAASNVNAILIRARSVWDRFLSSLIAAVQLALFGSVTGFATNPLSRASSDRRPCPEHRDWQASSRTSRRMRASRSERGRVVLA